MYALNIIQKNLYFKPTDYSILFFMASFTLIYVLTFMKNEMCLYAKMTEAASKRVKPILEETYLMLFFSS